MTSGQAFVAPIIEDVDQLYSLDISEAQEVDPTALADGDSDDYITIWGARYTKSAFISAMKAQGISIKANASDESVIKAVNALSDAEEAKLKQAVESVKA